MPTPGQAVDSKLGELHEAMMLLEPAAPLSAIFQLGSQYARAFETFYQNYEATVYYNSDVREFKKAIAQIKKRHRQVTDFAQQSETFRQERSTEHREFSKSVGAAIESLRAMVELSQLHVQRTQASTTEASISDLSPDINTLIDFHSRTRVKIAAFSDALSALYEPSEDE